MMRTRVETTPRDQEEKRLRNLANGGLYAPVRKENFFAQNRREELIEEYVKRGLEKFDEQQDELKGPTLG